MDYVQKHNNCINIPSLTSRSYSIFLLVNEYLSHQWCLHLMVAVGFERSRDPESYAGGSIATGRVTHAGQVKG
jgi:hypothetical protein